MSQHPRGTTLSLCAFHGNIGVRRVIHAERQSKRVALVKHRWYVKAQISTTASSSSSAAAYIRHSLSPGHPCAKTLNRTQSSQKTKQRYSSSVLLVAVVVQQLLVDTANDLPYPPPRKYLCTNPGHFSVGTSSVRRTRDYPAILYKTHLAKKKTNRQERHQSEGFSYEHC